MISFKKPLAMLKSNEDSNNFYYKISESLKEISQCTILLYVSL